jgi:hypothetical protein
MTAADGTAAQDGMPARQPGVLRRWWRRRRARRRSIDHAVWDLRERYGEAAYRIARASALAPVGFERRRFWRKVALKLQQLG